MLAIWKSQLAGAIAIAIICLALLHSGACCCYLCRFFPFKRDAEGGFLQSTSNEFFIGFTRNAGTPTTPQLYVTTTEPDPVNFFVETLTGVNITGTATRDSTTTITLPSSILVSSNTERNKGIHIQSEGNKRIVVYGLNYNTITSDAFLALPCHCLALEEYEYYAVTYDGVSHPGYPTTILVVGCEDNTTITTKFGTVTLNKKETYYIEDNGDLTGTRIVANQPISVFSSHTCTNVPSGVGACDHLTEQLPPTASWGSFFLVASLLGKTSGEIYRIIAAQDSTEITINCNTLAQPQTLALSNAGDWREIHLDADSYCAFESNNPILVMQFALSQTDGFGDPFMAMIPPVEQYGNNYVLSVLDRFSTNYITVAVAPRYFQPERIFVDDFNMANATWSTAYCFDGSVCGYILSLPMQPGAHRLYHEDANAKLGVTVYGFNSGNSYGYVGGLQLIPESLCTPECQNGECITPGVCVCDAGWTGPGCDSLIPPLAIRLINGSPVIAGSTVQVEFVLNRPATSVTCQIRRNEQQDCSSGSITFTDLDPGAYSLRIAASNSREDRAILRRRFEITSDPSLCTLHLINDGITKENDRATVEFAGTGPAQSFICKLDNYPYFTCTTPVMLSDLQAGGHTLRIIPSGCGRNRRPLRMDFQV